MTSAQQLPRGYPKLSAISSLSFQRTSGWPIICICLLRRTLWQKSKKGVKAMRRKSIQVMVFASLMFSAFVALAMAQERFALKSPNGIAFSEFRGYEKRQYMASTLTSDRVKINTATPELIAAHKAENPSTQFVAQL